MPISFYYDSFVPIEVIEDLDKTPKQKKKLALNMKQLLFELDDTVLHLMSGQPSVMKHELIYHEQYLGDQSFQHNYQREKARYLGMYKLYYKGTCLGVIQQRPHMQATIYTKDTPLLRFVQRLLERTLAEKLPQMKVTVRP